MTAPTVQRTAKTAQTNARRGANGACSCKFLIGKPAFSKMAEREGFEPSMGF